MDLTQSLFHSGKLSTRAKGLLQIEGTGRLRINPEDAARLVLSMAIVSGCRTRRGEMTTTVKIMERVPAGTVWFPYHFAQRAVHYCLNAPSTRSPRCRRLERHRCRLMKLADKCDAACNAAVVQRAKKECYRD